MLNGLKFLFTGGQYGSFVEGKLCPKCHVRRIKLHKKCCGPCYDKYYA
jgi:hypothetical protein